MVGLKTLPEPVLLGLLGGLIGICAAGSIGYGFGARHAEAQGNARLERLKAEHAEQARQVAIDSRVQLLQQVERANQAEALLLSQRDRNDQDHQQLQERIPHVTTVYRPAPAAAPVVIPRCVFTAGWVRDFNLALGAGMSTAGGSAATAGPAQAAWPTPGTDAELLESGVTPADILAHAQDYGRWARNNLAQLNALLDLQKD
ncbi:lysis protein [Pseudomonas aeruginosa]|uniref:lysis protein n=1 Tax=Pseudomonas aeruginosa TaxID=287 RepID=UPI001A2333D4|nr:lysis protein [Pseudomonas aeruginosa]MBH9298111.1 lysis protein [Pseudomonas aeruginosa]HCL3684473.1 lysis protein [Pseudomonas aeruginosa]